MAGLKFPIEQDEKYKAQVRFMAKGSSGSFGGIANLYFPEAVNFSDGLVYDNASLGIAGELARRASGGYSTAATGALDAVNQDIGKKVAGLAEQAGEAATSVMDTVGSTQNLKNLFTGNNPVANAMFSMGVQGMPGAGAIGSGVAAGTAVTANPHKRSVFRDVAVRTFSFSFLMSPQSQQESQSIENIIDFFRENAYPETILEGYGYKFPSKFFITFFYDGRKMSQAPKLLPCYLTSVNTVLNPRSSSFFEDGKANEVQLTMSFQEERALNKDDIKGGY
tara:strand:- start:4472 stop:5308 length:837 start_codon:yes stop_codon:yes gene_type:complete